MEAEICSLETVWATFEAGAEFRSGKRFASRYLLEQMAVPVETEVTKSKAQATLGRVVAGMETRQAPIVGQIVRIIKDISGRADKMSGNDLAEFISGEPTTMSRIISIAGSMGYNSSGVEISSIHHAISLIGFERVRSLAVSILLLEGAQSQSLARTNRELAGASLVSGLVAAEMARRGVPVDPELVFVCGALRNYGRMLAATFLPEDYAIACRLGGAEDEGEAFKSYFGISTFELGRQVLSGLQLPKVILNTMVNVSDHTRKRALDNPTAALITTADFGQRLADLLQAPHLTSDGFDARAEALSREYDRAFYLSRNSARDVLAKLMLTIESFASYGGFALGSVSLFRRLECLVLEQPLPPPFETVPSRPGARPAQAAAGLEAEESRDPGGMGVW